MPPVGESTENTDEDSRSNRRPIELIDSPAIQRSQISARCRRRHPTNECPVSAPNPMTALGRKPTLPPARKADVLTR